MNDNAIKNYAVWARRELISEVAKRCALYGIFEKDSLPANAEAIDGRVLSALEKEQRRDLLAMAKRDGYENLVERAAYTWFNRLLAIRFMEVNDRLPSHVRVLSAIDGSFKPQALSEALDLPLDALDSAKAAECVQRGDDESLFRLVFLAQCAELADCMPAVFDRVGSAMELLLPDGLLKKGGAVEQLVTSIPESDWTEGVEIVGWMYQYYVSERKDEVFASFKKGKKAERDAIAPATQLFTPNWIVRYLTENSLGRLWMLNNPDSSLVDAMPYFVKPDVDAETEFKRVSNPEEITVVDPACGSGHILVYAFELLAQMYAEAGYSSRDAARLIIEKNLSGMEIDPRAGAMASFALTMKACEVDSRFLRRGVSPRITVLSRIELDSEEMSLLPGLRKRRELVDAVAHLDECGSLLAVSAADLSAIEGDLASLAGNGSLFADSARAKLGLMADRLEPLSRRYDVVVANPPYMGGSNMNKWVSSWIKDNFANAKRDLCTCFIDRGFSLARDHGYISMITASSWMFISSFEEFRKSLLRRSSITSMIQQSTHGYAGVTVPTTMFVLAKDAQGVIGSYIRLEDFDRPQWQEPRALEALANPSCGWFYQAPTSLFGCLPGSPIAYWITSAMLNAFSEAKPLCKLVDVKKGMSTGKNEIYLRLWWEISNSSFFRNCANRQESLQSRQKWYPYNKGGEYRKWYGNNDYVIEWCRDGEKLKQYEGSVIRNQDYYFLPSVTWSALSSGKIAFRFKDPGGLHDGAGASFFGDAENLQYCAAALNSAVTDVSASILSPTLNYEIGQVSQYPVIMSQTEKNKVVGLSGANRRICKTDWDSFEASWDFRRHPLI